MATKGTLLRLARHLRGFTQIKSAEKLGVAQAVYSRMENDIVEVDSKLLAKAAAAFGVPVDFFNITDTVYGPPVSVHTMLRGNSQVTARDVEMITAELNLRLFHLRRFLENVELNQTLELPRLDVEMYDSPAAIADMVRLHWQLPEGPIGNLTRVLERAGIIVGYSDFHGAGVSGVTFAAPGQPPLILLNPNHPADRVRFTLAHELGHLVMHKFPTPEMETEANEFASVFLFPRKALHEAFMGRKPSLALLAALKPEWKLSMQGILYAAQRENIVTKNQAKYLWTQISSRGWRTREPASLDFEHDPATVLPTIIKTQIEDLGFSKSDLVKLSGVNEKDFDRLYPFGETAATLPRLRIVN
ncbi:ImmA/IrrE family metallo-endopeptidase [Sulfitobacter sp. KE34]|uniref:helix-turn-helix domain-containing protein n=1 Tax=unclassified Sulfitobacter TaxID=196795 RepID=UPI0023E28872|nr:MULTISPECIES: ImmA/IrrE family metallo-endopeptidase [unclassified Sulfitobacter]MDF3350481.1 ImmA/IrrE family metallo-endopeptidase [Sulfitobacter sp. KE12]MDF3354316.1 ImmA/IrrE family metallo-endopeptidase [Sulfitobacter sp. KE27]MDF3357801.1 ImmA/IrrE family metallo-endopeptidase [Sulfitobacter sp. KE33]MDF3360046.1 ImmA/IrrE family metallo-endopeptidase [Sulfitobacter sp. Ks41]MDF3365388.1 ImmA/IrrE family metallo-endopeptidase [Sulfitobacter sp. Ks34]